MYRIVIISHVSPFLTQLGGGAAVSMAILGKALASKGHDVVHVTYMPRKMSARRGLPWHETREESGTTVVTLVRASVPLSGRSGLLRRIERKISGLHTRWVLDRVARVRDADICYVFYDHDLIRHVAALRGSQVFPKLVVRMAGLRWAKEGTKGTSEHKRWNASLRQADALNFLSDASLEQSQTIAKDLGVDLESIPRFVADIGATVEPRALDQRRPMRGPLDLLCVQRFSSYQKRQDLLVKAIAQLPSDAGVMVTFIGEGPHMLAIQELAERLEIGSSIRFERNRPQRELWARICAADALVHPTEYEGVSKIVAEAMLLETVVVVSDVPTVDHIRHGVNGYRVANTVEQWASAIIGLRRERTRFASIGRAARATALGSFDVEAGAIHYEEAFGALIRSTKVPTNTRRHAQ